MSNKNKEKINIMPLGDRVLVKGISKDEGKKAFPGL